MLECGGETAYEAGRRWLSWFNDEVRTFEDPDTSDNDRALLVVGHNFITAYGVWMLTHPEEAEAANLPPLTATQGYKVGNGSALVLANHDGGWAVTDRIVPSEKDFAKAGSMVG